MIEAQRRGVLHIAPTKREPSQSGAPRDTTGGGGHRCRRAAERLGAHPVVFEDLFGIGHTSGHGSRDLLYEFSASEASSTIVSAAHDAAPSLTLANSLLSEWRPEY